MKKCETTLSGVAEIAPEVDFGGYKAADFELLVQDMRDVRDEIDDLEIRLKAARVRRVTVDAAALKAEEYIVNAIVGNRNYGPDSPLYSAIGRKRKSERRSGLTRRKKPNPAP